jgi:hypothetical protein
MEEDDVASTQQLDESIRRCSQIRFLVENNLFDENSEHNKHALQCLVNVQKTMNNLYSLNLVNMLD